MEMFKISEKVINFNIRTMENWSVEQWEAKVGTSGDVMVNKQD